MLTDFEIEYRSEPGVDTSWEPFDGIKSSIDHEEELPVDVIDEIPDFYREKYGISPKILKTKGELKC